MSSIGRVGGDSVRPEAGIGIAKPIWLSSGHTLRIEPGKQWTFTSRMAWAARVAQGYGIIVLGALSALGLEQVCSWSIGTTLCPIAKLEPRCRTSVTIGLVSF
jgi:hypothetical protein